jgi:flavin reductase (DIM6/NTAB) family NADH-FMN oxidoreductase RutF
VTAPADAFREVMGGVATPVAVVTTLTGDGPHGTTVSSFASLSLARRWSWPRSTARPAC